MLSHLFFADDLMLFYEASVSQMNVISKVLESFCYFSGQKINVSKSQVFFSPSTPTAVADQICSRLRFSRVDNLETYIGLPLLHDRVTTSTFDFIINKVRQKLSSWEARRLSFVGRITLARSILLAIPNYSMYTIRILVSICIEIEKISRNFIWGSSSKDKKVALISWERCCRPLNKGGLGIHTLSDQNKLFLMKLGFRLVSNHDSLWVQVLRKKYNIQETLLMSINRSNCSFVWRSLMQIWSEVLSNVYWMVGNRCFLNV